MGWYRKITFLLVALLVLSQLTYGRHTTTDREGYAFLTSLSGGQPASCDPFAPDVDLTITSLPFTTKKGFAGSNLQIGKMLARYKKNYKRTITSTPRIEPPVKEIDSVTAYIYAKETYSKPHFLSHLHHFLFRLTPF
jgi:hypothetical protein